MMYENKHEKVEKNVGWFFILTIFAISFGGLVEITPLDSSKKKQHSLLKIYAHTRR